MERGREEAIRYMKVGDGDGQKFQEIYSRNIGQGNRDVLGVAIGRGRMEREDEWEWE
jgi:hypothetical protein